MVQTFDLHRSIIDRDYVEARLIEAVRVFERLEAKGRKWATDGPWRLMNLDRVDRYSVVVDEPDAKMIERIILDPRPTREMIARAEEAVAWLALLNERQRILVLIVVRCLNDTRRAIPWKRLRDTIGEDIEPNAVKFRYKRALGTIVDYLVGRRRRPSRE